MDKLRDWGFPIGLAFAWVLAVAWTMSSLLLAAAQKPSPAPEASPPPAIYSAELPPS
ncbi:MAG TPA: hypothetical protein VKH65_11050 [Myxococcales bacterium]|nr:hypothetical protein [Myxococcales bacterium]